MAKNDIPLTLPKISKGDAFKEIQELAKNDSSRVGFTDHAEMRMLEREITSKQVMNVLRNGDLISDVEFDTEKERGWKCKIRRATAGELVTVVVKLVEREGSYGLVITTWS